MCSSRKAPAVRDGAAARRGLRRPARRMNLAGVRDPGFGADGPFVDKAGHDLNYVAYAGVLDQLAAPDGTPILPNFQIRAGPAGRRAAPPSREFSRRCGTWRAVATGDA